VNIGMDIETFQNLPATEVARLVRAAGPKVCVFPINGTRRWFTLEHPPRSEEDAALAYQSIVGQRYIELYQLLFDHGLDTILTPVFGGELLELGENYAKMVTDGMARLANHPAFTDFYRAYGVRVRFYGDYRLFFAGTPYAYLSDLFDEATARTMAHDRRRLFFGVCANDASETVARLSIAYHARHSRAPDKRALVELYYGEWVSPADIFIGFDRFWAFDMPLVATGREDLYFAVSPSPYLTARGLRAILHDHLYLRWAEEPDYATMGAEALALMRNFYRANRETVLGVGVLRGGIWYPLAQLDPPGGLAGMECE
jgi:tuberculosinol/isotuberculosinol synthase